MTYALFVERWVKGNLVVRKVENAAMKDELRGMWWNVLYNNVEF